MQDESIVLFGRGREMSLRDLSVELKVLKTRV